MVAALYRRSPLGKRQLLKAARHVVACRKTPGFDGLRPQALHGKALGLFVSEVHRRLAQGTWRPRCARTGRMKRAGQSDRIHAISTLADAVVLRAATDGLAHVWKALPASIVGGRPDGNHHHLVDAVTRFLMKGGRYIFRFDIKGAFANAAFDKAIERLRGMTDRQDMVDVIVRWRKKQGTRFEGLVEGAPFAPLLLAVLLGDAARVLELLDGTLRIWLDDGVFTAPNEETALEAERLLRLHLKEVDLGLHPKKTGQHVHDSNSSTASSFHFLGFRWRGWTTEPLPKDVDAVLDELHALAASPETRNRIGERWSGWVSAIARWDSRLQVLDDVDVRFTKEIGEPWFPWGPYDSLVARAEGVALRGRQERPRARWLHAPGTSGSSDVGKRLRAGAVPGTASPWASTAGEATSIPTHSNAAEAPGAGMGLAPGAGRTHGAA